MNQTPKIKQLNFKVPEDFYWKLKNFATTKRIKMAEVLERAFKFYEQREKIVNEINLYRQTIPAIEQQMQTFQGKMNLEEFRSKINNLNFFPFNKIGLIITYEILREVLEEYLKASRRLEENNNMRTISNWNLN